MLVNLLILSKWTLLERSLRSLLRSLAIKSLIDNIFVQRLGFSVVQLKGKHCQKPHCHNGVVDTFGHQNPRKKSCSVLWTVPDNILTYFFSCEIAAPPTVQWRESSLDAQYRKPRKRDRGDSMHHQITSSSHHPHPESPFKSKSGKNNDLFSFLS